MSLPDGAKVAYIGVESDGLSIGDQATVLEGGAYKSHVRWDSGAVAGSYSYIRNSDLVAGASLNHEASLVNAVDMAGNRLVRFAVRETYDDGGPSAVLRSLRREGHGAFLDSLGEEVLRQVQAKVRNDPSVIEVLASLDDDEGDDFVRAVSLAVLQDAGR